MKHTLKIALVLFLILTLAACGNKEEAGGKTTAVNPHGYKIVPVEAANLPLNLPDLDAAVINGNYALEAKLNETHPAIAVESFDAESSVRRTNYIAVKEGNEDSLKTKALVGAIVSDEVKKYIENTYKGAVIPSFVDPEGNKAAGNEIPEAGDDKVIRVGATLVPHAEILNDIVKDVLAAKGWTLEVVEFSDYVQPNTALEEGELDANYFQTLGYLKNQNEERGMHLTAVVGVHIEPMGVYSKSAKALSDLLDGDVIGVPNDTDNYGRAIDFLNALGLLDGAPTSPDEISKING